MTSPQTKKAAVVHLERYRPDSYYKHYYFDRYEAHPWIYSLKALTLMLEGTITISHGLSNPMTCPECIAAYEARCLYNQPPSVFPMLPELDI